MTSCATTSRTPCIPLSITPLNATKDMKTASAITSAIDHLETVKAKNFTTGLLRNIAGRKRATPKASVFSAGKITLNSNSSTATSVISGRPIWMSV